jgi:hypothetical protein
MANEVVIDMATALQNEGIATHISRQLAPAYPSPFEVLGDEYAFVRAYNAVAEEDMQIPWPAIHERMPGKEIPW